MAEDFSNLRPSEQLEKAMESCGILIFKYRKGTSRPITSNRGIFTIDKFSKMLLESLGANVFQFGKLHKILVKDPLKVEPLVEKYAKKSGVAYEDGKLLLLQENLPKGLTLNLDISNQDKSLKFFVTTADEIRSPIGGYTYVRMMGMKEDEALSKARQVIPAYMPRSPQGISKEVLDNGHTYTVFNDYTPPEWMLYKEPLPDRLPKLFERLVNHLFPIEVEREYFYCWLYASLFDRAFVYLILCGAGGTGKNRLKLVLRALHGHMNTVDGKRSTFAEKFNSQLSDNTLAWFDELHYTREMENTMKELQNDSISIERKGIDATRSTRIYSSCVISNNKPRDNYIAFDARKFVPLQITDVRLDEVMTGEEISTLTNKVETTKVENGYDVAFIAQIGRWIKKHGAKKKWLDKNLEYKGPMFYKLAHTSMAQWQKRAAQVILTGEQKSSHRVTYDHRKGYLWSSLEGQIKKKNGYREQLPDYSTVNHFFTVFVDSQGRKAFRTTPVENDLLGDFWVMPCRKNVHITSESEAMSPYKETDDGQEEYDL